MRKYELAAAGITDPLLVEAYAACSARVRRRNPAAYPTTRCLLPVAKRPYYDAALAFCRHADDLIDAPERTPEERAQRFDRFQETLLAAPRHRTRSTTTDGRIAAAFTHFASTWGITTDSLGHFLEVLRSDLHVTSYQAYRDLEHYMRWVSGEPAAWINLLLEPSTAEAEHRAISLSHALYLLHFLDDIGEDLELGRVYLPEDDLAQCGLTRESLRTAVSGGVTTGALRLLARCQADRVDRLLTESEDWWRLVHPSSRWFVQRYHRLARQSLRTILRRDYEVLLPVPRTQAMWNRTKAMGGTGLTYARALATRP
ncbi:phytoene/squalene synthase family protein [Saccharopolyspora gloriosae]|uniref:Phytoene synthase n=1 Tax=Saccharopolyspora gloriosae TaxID=455344 RepID=A0A840NPI1_9PSEU|nr:squalene/phytoene synthase family protein [Saccharopolyspora gloriosae]MBB5070157.1 phytoene synthase [Saccharopolyspora gloriosae]